MTGRVALAVDGGATKTDLALLSGEGELLSLVRGPLSSPHYVGLDASLDVVDRLLDDALREAGLERDGRPVAEVGRVLMAGADMPTEEVELQAAVERRGWADRPVAGNDTFAVLRAGTERAWGVAVVCGTGINCVGVGPDGAQARFPALGLITGEWGGGYDVGLAGLGAAVQAADGRGPRTSLEQAVAAHFGAGSALEVAESVHTKSMPAARIGELARVVWSEAAAGDEAAGAIVDRLAGEVLGFARAAIERLELLDQPVEVVLGGTLLRTAPDRLAERVQNGLTAIAPEAHAVVVAAPPIAGAALLALDDLAANDHAKARARGALTEAAARLADSDG